jgi:hypothetical protein
MCNKSQGFYGLDGMLSPAAQAVMVAWESEWSKGSFCLEERSVAAALRAAADQVVPEQFEPPTGENEPWPRDYQLMSDSKWEQRQHTRRKLLAIAAELEGGND